jgi:hypothetical protein
VGRRSCCRSRHCAAKRHAWCRCCLKMETAEGFSGASHNRGRRVGGSEFRKYTHGPETFGMGVIDGEALVSSLGNQEAQRTDLPLETTCRILGGCEVIKGVNRIRGNTYRWDGCSTSGVRRLGTAGVLVFVQMMVVVIVGTGMWFPSRTTNTGSPT